jgi:hypothetical protein
MRGAKVIDRVYCHDFYRMAFCIRFVSVGGGPSDNAVHDID